MKKIGLICIATLTCLSLAACGNQSTKKNSSPSKETSSKVVKHYKKKYEKKQSSSPKPSLNSSSASLNNNSQNGNQQNTQSQKDTASESSNNSDSAQQALNQSYKGYSTYQDYLNANGGDPDVQKQTDEMQTQWEIRNGYANSDGTPTAKGQSLIDAYNNGEFGN